MITLLKCDTLDDSLISSKTEAKNPSFKCNCNDILVVDDEIFNINAMKFILKKKNLEADSCVNGLEAIEKVKQRAANNCQCRRKCYKLIFMDIFMPIMDGLEASSQIQDMVNEKTVSSKTNIVIISAHNEEEIIATIQKWPVIKEFVPKPAKRTKKEELLNRNCL